MRVGLLTNQTGLDAQGRRTIDVLAAALSIHLELEVRETGTFAVQTDLDIPRDRSNLVVKAFDNKEGKFSLDVQEFSLKGEAKPRRPKKSAPLAQNSEVFDQALHGLVAFAGPEYPDFVCFQFIAHFIEVSIDPNTYQVRVPRAVSVVDCGKVLSACTSSGVRPASAMAAINASPASRCR